MKFGRIIATLESEGSLLNTDKVVAINDQVQGTDVEPELPAGLDEENVTPNPDESPAEQAVDIIEATDPEADKKVVEVTQGEEQDYETPAKLLDEIQEAGNASAANQGGTLTRLEAQSVQLSVESIMGSLKMDVPAMPTLEAYASTWSGKEATRVTMESVMESAKNVGKKIVAGLKAMLEYCVNFLVGLTKNRALMEKNIERLITKAKEIQKSTWEYREDVVSGRFVHGLSTKGGHETDGIYAILEDSGNLIYGYEYAYMRLRDIRDGKKDGALADLMASIIASRFRDTGSTASPTTEDDVALKGYFVNGMSLGLVTDERGEKTLRFISNAGKTARVKNSTMEAVDPVEVINVLNNALELIRRLRSIEATTNRIADSVKGIIRQVEGEYYNLRGNLGSSDYARKAKANKDARDAQEIIRRLIVRFPSMVFSAVKNTSDWASAQINNYRV